MSSFLPDTNAFRPRCAGLYVHVPFCVTRCAYCNFYSTTRLSRRDDYAAAAMAEMALAQTGRELMVDTVYFGGGTPSLLPAPTLEGLLLKARSCFNLAADPEITVEVNPESTGRSLFAAYRRIGVNRLHVGVQSFNDDALHRLGRVHGGAAARKAFDTARAGGFDNIGIDLIYGIPGQDVQAWRRDLSAALDLEPEHISCYALSFEPGTRLAAARRRGVLPPVTEAQLGRFFQITGATLRRCGYEHYEISNFAKTPALRSRHNQKYWFGAPYIGIGPSAHSFRNGRRWWNHRSLQRYLENLAAGRRPTAGSEHLSRLQQMIEAVYLRLRTADGLNLADFNRRFNIDLARRAAGDFEDLAQKGFLRRSGDVRVLTLKGLRFHESIAAMLIERLP